MLQKVPKRYSFCMDDYRSAVIVVPPTRGVHFKRQSHLRNDCKPFPEYFVLVFSKVKNLQASPKKMHKKLQAVYKRNLKNEKFTSIWKTSFQKIQNVQKFTSIYARPSPWLTTISTITFSEDEITSIFKTLVDKKLQAYGTPCLNKKITSICSTFLKAWIKVNTTF